MPLGSGSSSTGDADEARTRADIDMLSASLGGALPCVTCGYNLQGLSILTICPECGSAVRATILAVVDPLADELRPIKRPRLVATGLLVWSIAALLAAVVAWYAWSAYVLFGLTQVAVLPLPWGSWPLCVGGCVAISGLGAIGLLWPHDGLGARNFVLALGGVLLYPLLALTAYMVAAAAEAAVRTGLLELWSPWPDRPLMRLAGAVLLVGVILGLRPNARALVARSLALRTGRVDRQTLLAMAAVAALAALGDVLGMIGVLVGGLVQEGLRTLGFVLMIVGSALFTLGLIGCVVDSARIAASVLAPGPSLRDVIEHEPARRERPTTGGGQ